MAGDGEGDEEKKKPADTAVDVARQFVPVAREGVEAFREVARDVIGELRELAGTYVDFRKSQADMLPEWQRVLTLLDGKERADVLRELVELERDRLQRDVELAEIARAHQLDRLESQNEAQALRIDGRMRLAGGVVLSGAGAVAISAAVVGASSWMTVPLYFVGAVSLAVGMSMFSPKAGGRVLDFVLRRVKASDGPQQLPPDRSE